MAQPALALVAGQAVDLVAAAVVVVEETTGMKAHPQAVQQDSAASHLAEDLAADHLAGDLTNLQATIAKPGMKAAAAVEVALAVVEEEEEVAVEDSGVAAALQTRPQMMVGMRDQAVGVEAALAGVEAEAVGVSEVAEVGGCF